MITFIKRPNTPIGNITSLGEPHFFWRQPTVFPPRNHPAKHPRWPAFGINIFGFHQLFQQPDLIISVENGKIRPQTHKIGMAAQHFGSKRMKRAKPYLLGHRPNQTSNAQFHLACSLVGKGHRQNIPRLCGAAGNQFSKARGQYTRFTGTGTRQNQQWPIKGFHSFALCRIKPIKPWAGWRFYKFVHDVFKLANADGWVNRNAMSWVTYFFIILPNCYLHNAE